MLDFLGSLFGRKPSKKRKWSSSKRGSLSQYTKKSLALEPLERRELLTVTYYFWDGTSNNWNDPNWKLSETGSSGNYWVNSDGPNESVAIIGSGTVTVHQVVGTAVTASGVQLDGGAINLNGQSVVFGALWGAADTSINGGTNASDYSELTVTSRENYPSSAFQGTLTNNIDLTVSASSTWGAFAFFINNAGNNYTGSTTIESGTSLANGYVHPETHEILGSHGLSPNSPINVDAGGHLVMYYQDATIPSLQGSGTVSNTWVDGTGSGTYTLTLNSNDTTEKIFSGTIYDGDGQLALSKSGSGIQTLSGTNTYTGTTTVTAGTLRAGSSGGLSAWSILTVNGGVVDLNDHNVRVEGLTSNNPSTGQIVNNGTGAATLTVAGNNRDDAYYGQLVDHTGTSGGTLGLKVTLRDSNPNPLIPFTPTGDYALRLMNSGNTYSGTTTIATYGPYNYDVSLNNGNGDSGAGGLSPNSPVEMGTHGILYLANRNATIAGLSNVSGLSGSAGTIANWYENSGAATLTINTNIADKIFSGYIINGSTNSELAVTKTGNRRQTLIGTGTYTYTGDTTINEGILELGDGTNNGLLLHSDITIANNATLQFNTGTAGDPVYGHIISGGGNVTKLGAGKVTFSGAASTYTGVTTIAGGTLSISSVANAGFASAIGAPNTDSDRLVLANGAKLQYDGSASTPSTNRGFTLDTGGGTIEIGSGFNLTISGVGTGSNGTLTKTSGGTLTLSGANTYTGATTINDGTLSIASIADGGTASPIGQSTSASTNLVLANGAKLQYTGGTAATNRGFTLGTGGGTVEIVNSGANLTFGGVGTGSGALTKTGAGTLTLLDSTNSYGTAGTVGTLINGGTLSVTAAGNLGNGNLSFDGGTLKVTGSGSIAIDKAITLVGGGTIEVDAGRTITINQAITGSNGTLTKTGGGTLTLLDSTNSYGTAGAVGTLINGGTLSVTAAGNLGNGNLSFNGGTLKVTGSGTIAIDKAITLEGAGTIEVDAGRTVTINQAITGSNGTLTKTGGGTLTLSGTNSYGTVGAVGTLINGGTLSVTAAGNLGNGNLSFNGGTLKVTGSGTIAIDKAITLEGAGTIEVDAGRTVTNNRVISGGGALTKTGGGTLTLSGANNYEGGTTISGGTLQLATGGSLLSGSNLTLANNGTFSLISGSQNLGVIQGPAGTTLALGSGTLTVTIAEDITIASIITGTTASGLTKDGSGKLTLSGSNTFSGTTRIQDGSLTLGNNLALQNSTLNYDDDGTFSFGDRQTVTLGGLTGSNNLPLINDSSQAVALTLKSGNYYGELSDAGSLTVSSGTVTLRNANTFTGNTTLSSGTVVLGDPLALQNSTVVFGSSYYAMGSEMSLGGIQPLAAPPGGGGSLSFGSLTQATLGGLSGGSYATSLSLTNASGGRVDLSIGENDQSTTFWGYFSGLGSLTKVGAGTLSLNNASGGSSSYTGGTTLAEGVLAFAPGRLGTSGDIHFRDGTLRWLPASGGGGGGIHGDISNRIIIDDGYTAVIDTNGTNVTFASSLRGQSGGANNGNLMKTGTGTLTLGAANAFSGTTTITGGTLTLASAYALQNSTLNYSNPSGTLGFSGVSATTLGGLAGSKNLSLPSGFTLSVGNNNTNTAYTGVLSGSGSLTKTGSGTFTLSGANTYAGTTTISTGTLQVDGVNVLPFGPGKQYITVNGTLDLNGRSVSVNGLNGNLNGRVINSQGNPVTLTVGNGNQPGTFAGIIQHTAGRGAIGLTKTGTGAQNLYGANSYAGNTFINEGTLVLAYGDDRLPTTTTVTLGNGATSGVLQLGNTSGACSQTLAGLLTSGSGPSNFVIGGASSVSMLTLNVNNTNPFGGRLGGNLTNNNLALTKIGAGTLVLSGANSYSGGTTISEGILEVSAQGALGSTNSLVTVIEGAELDFNLAGSGTFDNAITNYGAVLNLNNADEAMLALSDIDCLDAGYVWNVNNGNLTMTGDIGSFDSWAANSGSGDFLLEGNVFSGSISNDSHGSFTLTGALHGSASAINYGDGDLNLQNATNLDGGWIENLGGGDLTVSGEISGFAHIQNLGGGQITLAGNNSALHGDILLGAGTLSFVSGGLGNASLSVGGISTVEWLMDNTDDISQRLSFFNNPHVTFNIGANDVPMATGFGNSSTASVTKLGSGTLTLAGSNSYTGGTTVSAGVLNITGLLASTSVNVAGGTLAGSGTIAGTVTVGGTGILAPATGTTPATLHAGNLDFNLDATYRVLIQDGTTSGECDRIEVAGNVTLCEEAGEEPELVLLGAPAGNATGVLVLIVNGGSNPTVGQFGGLPDGGPVTLGDKTYTITYHYNAEDPGSGDGNDVALLPPRPTMLITGASEVDEGSDYVLSLGLVEYPDVNSSPIESYRIHWGDATITYTATQIDSWDRQVARPYADGPANYTISVDLIAQDGMVYNDVASTTITVNDVPPEMALLGPGTTIQGAPYVLTLGAVDDPGQDTVASYTIYWGEGEPVTYTSGELNALNRQVCHYYSSSVGEKLIHVEFEDEDDDDSYTTETKTIHVYPPADLPPQFTSPLILDAYVGQEYQYVSRASDSPWEDLEFSLGETIWPAGTPEWVPEFHFEVQDEGTLNEHGLITWAPPAVLAGKTVTIYEKVAEEDGGNAIERRIDIFVHAAQGNHDPEITSKPTEQYARPVLPVSEDPVTPTSIPPFSLRNGETWSTMGNPDVSYVSIDMSGIDLETYGGVDTVFIVDESGSMAEAQAWIASVVGDMDDGLVANGFKDGAGLSTNHYALIGYARGGPGIPNSVPPEYYVRSIPVGGATFGTAGELATAVNELVTDGGPAWEDGYAGIDKALSDFSFRSNALVNFVLVTDTKRMAFPSDVYRRSQELNFDVILEALKRKAELVNDDVTVHTVLARELYTDRGASARAL